MKPILFTLVFLLASCGETKEIRRHNRASKRLVRITEKFPELLKKDTVRASVSYIKPKTELSIKYIETPSTDTIVWRNGDATLIRWVDGDTINYNVVCDTVEVFSEVEIPIEKIQPIEYKPLPLKWWQKALMWIGGISIVVFIIKSVIKSI